MGVTKVQRIKIDDGPLLVAWSTFNHSSTTHNANIFMFCTLNNSLFGITRVVFRGISKFGIIYVEILLKIVERIYLIIYNIYKIKFKKCEK
jgi:hypothetical protein